MKKLVLIMLICSTVLFGCQNNQAPKTVVTTVPTLSQQSTEEKNNEITYLENPQIKQITNDTLWQDTPTIYKNWTAWSELKYVGNFPVSKIVLLNSEGKQIEIPTVADMSQDNASFFNNKLFYLEKPNGISAASVASMNLKMVDLDNLKPYSIGNYFVEAYIGKFLLLSQDGSYSIFDTDYKTLEKIPESTLNSFHGIFWVSNNNDEIYFFTRDKRNEADSIFEKDVKLYNLEPQNFQTNEILNIGPQSEEIFNGISGSHLYLGLYNESKGTYDFFKYQLGSPQTKESLFSIPSGKYSFNIGNFEVSEKFIMFTFESGSVNQENNKLFVYDQNSQKLYDTLSESPLEFSRDGNFILELNMFPQNHISENEIVFPAYPKVDKNRKLGAESYNQIEIFKLKLPLT